MNLLSETLDKMRQKVKTPDDVEQVTWAVITKQVTLKDGEPAFQSEERWCSWKTFAEAARTIDYDNGYGHQEIEDSLEILFKDGSWLQRWEYDGSEGWEYVVPRSRIGGEPVTDKVAVRRVLRDVLYVEEGDD